jgi:exopolyphosphatase / guanosine-5'-triphosphate,3'-diphosphate pyrophosphatase
VNDAPPAGAAAGQRLAAVDVGSNSIRLLVTEVAVDGTYRVLDDEKQTTRLAQGLAAKGSLGEPAMQHTLEALGHMQAIAAGYGVKHIEVIATSAVREASNGDAFLQLVHEKLGLQIEVIAAEEEGRLSFDSIARHFNLQGTSAVAVDLGGGSAEVVLVADGVIETIHSLPLGAVRLTEGFIHSDPCSDADFKRLRRHIRDTLEATVGDRPFRRPLMIGAGGTFMALANIAMRRRGLLAPTPAGYELNRPEVRHILNYLRELPLRARKNVAGLHADRADIIIAGLTVIERLMKRFAVQQLLIHDQGVRDGLLLRMVRRVLGREGQPVLPTTDPLEGVRQFAVACGVEPTHSRQVTRLVMQLFAQLREPLGLTATDSRILEAAAILHEVGYLINYEKHHQHSYHLIMHGNLRGLAPRERELVANVARYHTRSAPKRRHPNFARLADADRQTVLRLSALLRVADGLDRTHMQWVEKLECSWEPDHVRVSVVGAQRPDVDLWHANQKAKLFKKVFGRELRLVWQATGEPAK